LGGGGTSTDKAPTDQLLKVAGGERVKKFGRGRELESSHFKKEATREAEPLVKTMGLVEEGVVEEPSPAKEGARLFNEEAYDEKDLILELFLEGGETLGVFEKGVGFMDGTGADNSNDAGVSALDDGAGLRTGTF
jgi:hypothetical protein